jgi:tRNA(Arg) A34 adenosine deaminase TadA
MNEFMKKAKELSEVNLRINSGGPFGACIVKDGIIIGEGRNEVLEKNDPTAHAEIMAIRKAADNIKNYDLSGSVIYTSCFPCPMCLSAIMWANIDKIYYGNTKEDAKSIGFRDKEIYEIISKINNNEEVLDMKCIDREETIKVFNEYMKKDNKETY